MEIARKTDNMTVKHFFLIAALLYPIVLSAQTDDFRAAYESFKNQARKEYEDFWQRVNAEYAEWVRKAWREYKTLPAIPKPKDDKTPPVVIKEEDKQKPIENRPVVIEEEITVPDPEPQPVPIAPVREQPQPVEKYLEFSLYGTEMKVRAGDNLRFSLPDVEGASIAAAWERLASEDYNNLIRDCLELRIRHKLCDWSYMRLLDVMSQKLLGKHTNEAELLKAFVFCQSGYQMRLAFDNDKLRMLFASQFCIFDKPCWEIDGTLYYSDDVNVKELSVCEAAFPNERAMSLFIPEEQVFGEVLSDERILKNPDIEWMKAHVTVNENLMMFYNDYPTSYFGEDFMTRWALYANTPMQGQVKETLYPQLKEWIKGKSAYNAVDLLCFWIQKAFVYEYDDVVWGHDRAFFADETLYYPYCDCEDRSILLTRLVRDLLGLKCALVYYPGHLATAIAVGEDAKGDYIRIDGVKFLVCDPTYIGAPIGMTMPDMDNKTAKVIVLN